MWLIGSDELESFSTRKTWEVLRQRSESLRWTDQVWFKGAIPRHAFMMWLMHLDRLPTHCRLTSWGLQIDMSCCLCDLLPETRDHIFLHCEVRESIWLEVNNVSVITRSYFTRGTRFQLGWMRRTTFLLDASVDWLLKLLFMQSGWNETINTTITFLPTLISCSSESIFKLEMQIWRRRSVKISKTLCKFG